MSKDTIRIRGVRVNNLKNVDLDLPRGKLIAICGLSGSGKTSLAIDTLYAEGQRRYIESFSAYTRQFLQRLDKPDYDTIDGLPPALAVRRSQTPRGNRSTVGTASESIDYLRLLFSKIASLNCYQCGASITEQTPQQSAQFIAALPKSQKVMIAYEISWDSVAERAEVLADLQASGFLRLVSNSQEIRLGETEREKLGKALPRSGSAWSIVDRLKGGDSQSRSTESLETAYERGYGNATLFILPDSSDKSTNDSTHALQGVLPLEYEIDGKPWSKLKVSRRRVCTKCSIEYPAAQPRLFSFNSPLGACPKCEGFGDTIDLDMNLVVPDKNKSLRDGAIAPWTTPSYSCHLDELSDIADGIGIPMDVPYRKLTKKQQRVLRQGSEQDGFQGLDGFFKWLERKKYKMHVRVFLSRWRSYNQCTHCAGTRLSQTALSYRVDGKNFSQLCRLEIDDLKNFLTQLPLTELQREIAHVPYSNVLNRLDYLSNVGLGYLSLDRSLRTLSGGEAQRTALAAALGSSLVNMLYVLDEPSVGLHPSDVMGLSNAIRRLTSRGNTVLIVEHEDDLLQQADWLVEVGPQAGSGGGQVICAGPRDKIKPGKSLTNDYLLGVRSIPVPPSRRTPSSWLEITQCSGNNLQSIDVKIPLGVLCLVTGVSGSGKSTLVQETLSAAIANRLSGSSKPTLAFAALRGVGKIDECIVVDQNPISRSPRSNPVTYVKAFDEIRSVFASSIEAKTRNYGPGHFSFNSDLGRCENCRGDGSLQIDMQFLADIHVTCPECNGSRYRTEILRIRYRDRSIADVLKMTVDEAKEFFRGATKVQRKLQVLIDVGLGYLRLGQSATTLSAGEAQRLKLASHLASSSHNRCLFILDEPTTGLHTHDLLKLLGCFSALVDAGHSLLVVEHNMHLIAAADHLIDLGPGAAHMGGRVIATGTPEQVASTQESKTGNHLKKILNRRK